MEKLVEGLSRNGEIILYLVETYPRLTTGFLIAGAALIIALVAWTLLCREREKDD